MGEIISNCNINRPRKLVSLFAGIGGFELAFQSIDVTTILMCEIDPIAQRILKKRIPGVELISDICDLERLPQETDILCAGFPCQDISTIGEKQGLSGTRSSLIKEVFRLLGETQVEWVVIENVTNMLHLHSGETIRTIVRGLEKLGYNWAYRTIDSIAFVPQHRSRVYVVASRNNDPRDVLLSGESKNTFGKVNELAFERPLGFYWTEGKNALGLVEDAIPTLKAGSTIGIPSPPAIIFPDGNISTPHIRDAEKLQGFPEDWTKPAESISKPSSRWKLVGNAVTVDTVSWIANKIITPEKYDSSKDKLLSSDFRWPKAAWGYKGKTYMSSASLYPVSNVRTPLTVFLKHPGKPLSLRAAKGFEKRLLEGRLHSPTYFINAIRNYINKIEDKL